MLTNNFNWCQTIVDELVTCGARDFFFAPGSRNAPIIHSILENPLAKAAIHFDERGLGFYALGHLKGNQKVSCVISTSGTAVANFFPAVIEAFQSKLPLFIITADRPLEWVKSGVNQTIDQMKIFGNYVHHFIQLPIASEEVSKKQLRSKLSWLYQECLEKGPIHLNIPLREPLFDSKKNTTTDLIQPNKFPKTFYHQANCQTNKIKDFIENKIQKTRKGVLILGKKESPYQDEKTLKTFCQKLNWPIISDIASFSRHVVEKNLCLNYHELLLKNKKIEIDTVIHLGGSFVSKQLIAFLKENQPKTYLQINDFTQIQQDPASLVTDKINLCEDLFLKDFTSPMSPQKKNEALIMDLKQEEKKIEVMIKKKTETTLNEISLANELIKNCPSDISFFVGNSCPIRDMDYFTKSDLLKTKVYANRGASGIDGLLATASGVSDGLKKPIWVVLGDLSFLHDLNSITLFKNTLPKSALFIINNQGGHIFRNLPIFESFKKKEDWLFCKHNYQFNFIENFLKIPYFHIKSLEKLNEVLTLILKQETLCVVEIEINAKESAQIKREINKEL